MSVRRRKASRNEAQLGFDALSIEGGLLSPEWLSKIAQLQAGTQSESDYHVPKGLNLRDEIGRYWRIAQAHWSDFASARAGNADRTATATRFVLALLRGAFGFGTLIPIEPLVLQERSYPVGHAGLAGRVPVVVAPAAGGLDVLLHSLGDGTRKRSAFGLAQEYLNAQEGALWGIATDGATLRIVRDNASLTRPAWIEADLQRIFTEERYSDFAALWLLCHESRFGREGQPVTECALEAWRTAGREEGTRAREHLRQGVEEAIVALGQGFLAHPENAALRADLQSGALPAKDYFNQLLRLVYRVIFLITVEERGLLHPDTASEGSKALYAAGYSIRRLRERSVKRSAHDRHADLWEATKIVFGGLAGGEARLGLPALAGIFATSECAALDSSKLSNGALLLAVFKLAWLREAGGLSRVNWRDMGPEELGSVYESLLELVPQIAKDGREFTFATGAEAKGNTRKTTGSYYTPDSLVQVLLDSALEPVIAETAAKNPGNAVDALLGLSIVDPACGSGHFLLAAARRLAAHLARLQANGTPSAAEYRHALRQVVGRCIFGVDLNPMAVELCKVGLWMEAVEPGLPLTFLNSHIQHGNALLGTTPELMAKGIPDAAWDPIEGDDKKIASALKKRNKKHAVEEQAEMVFLTSPAATEADAVARAMADLDAASDVDVAALAEKEARWSGVLRSTEYQHQKLVADAWCAAFVWPKQPGELTDAAPTNEVWRQLRDGRGTPGSATKKTIDELAEQYRFFHWHLQFPQVFAKGGFDVVLGNPPWERVKLQEQEFFASRSEEIAKAVNAAARKKLIAKLPEQDPQLWEDWCAASRKADGESHSIRQSGRYPLCGKGDVNTYAIFAEHNRGLRAEGGRAGFVVPSGIATDDTTKSYFERVVLGRELISLFDFQSGPGLFGEIGHARFKFCLLTLGRNHGKCDLVFFARSTAELSDPSRRVQLGVDDFYMLNPNTRTCPAFRSRRDAEITRSIYQRFPVLIREEVGGNTQNEWGLTIRRYLDMNRPDTLALCAAAPSLNHDLPVFEAKLMHQYESRFGDYSARRAGAAGTSLPDVGEQELKDPNYSIQPRYWIGRSAVSQRSAQVNDCTWLFVWRDICRSFDERTVIAAIVPLAGSDFTLRVANASNQAYLPLLLAVFNSFVFDFVARQKLGGTHLSDYITKQLPVPSPSVFELPFMPFQVTFAEWVLPRVVELTYTTWQLEGFAKDQNYSGPPFRYDGERRRMLRCELDAAIFHLYGLSRENVIHVLDGFHIVRRADEVANAGEFITKSKILAVFDGIAEAVREQRMYISSLSPAPASDQQRHLPTKAGVVVPLPRRRPLPPQRAASLEVTRSSLPGWSDEVVREASAMVGLPVTLESWSASLTGMDLGTKALAAVLRNIGGDAAQIEVERAVLLVLLPRLMLKRLGSKQAAAWRRIIGAADIRARSFEELSISWAEVVRRARSEKILEVAEGRWRAGVDVNDAGSAELDARALVGLSWLESSKGSAVDDSDLMKLLKDLHVA